MKKSLIQKSAKSLKSAMSSMKKNVFRLVAVGLVAMMVVASSAFAGRGGNIGNGGGVRPDATADTVNSGTGGRGTDQIGTGGRGVDGDHGIGHVVVSEGTPFTYTGEIVAVNEVFAIDILTADGQTVTVHGVGTNEYWETLTVARPVLGDTVTITGYSVEFHDILRNIAFTVEVNGETVEIRDADGNPVWKHDSLDILSGTPFEYSGTVKTVEAGFRNPMVITTDAGEEIAVRIGSPIYWDSLGVTQPVVGDSVTVTGYALTVNNVQTYFAATVKIGDNTVQLLDADGKPLWKQGSKGNGGKGGRGNCVVETE